MKTLARGGHTTHLNLTLSPHAGTELRVCVSVCVDPFSAIHKYKQMRSAATLQYYFISFNAQKMLHSSDLAGKQIDIGVIRYGFQEAQADKADTGDENVWV